MPRPLFVIGCSRSGTTALTDYMNLCEEIMICRERYKFATPSVDPTSFTFKRILDYEPRRDGETDIPREHHVELLGRKVPERLRWIGDKIPANSNRFNLLDENNPGAHFLMTYRPIEDVVESHEDRAKNLEDPWIDGKDGLTMGVEGWNRAMSSMREYLENTKEPNGLIVAYDEFFSNSESYVPLLSHFLEIEIDDGIRNAWRETSRRFEESSREKEPLSEEKAAYIEANKNHEDEAWVLRRIERQYEEPGLYKRSPGEARGRRRLAAAVTARNDAEGTAIVRLRKRKEDLERKVESAEQVSRSLRKSNRKLASELEVLQNSSSWKVAESLNPILAWIRKPR